MGERIRAFVTNKKVIANFIIAIFFLCVVEFYGLALLSLVIVKGGIFEQGDTFQRDYVKAPFHTAKVIIKPETPTQAKAHQMWLSLQLPALVLTLATIYKASKHNKPLKAKDASDYGAHGTARWATKSEIKSWFVQKEDEKGLFLGKINDEYCIHPVPRTVFTKKDRKKVDLNQNAAVYGSAGAQKSRTVVIPNVYKAIEDGFSIVLTDSKGDVYNQTADLLRQNDYEIKVLNYLRPEQSNCYNNLDFLDDASDVIRFVNNIINNTSNPHSSSDEMWKNAEQAYITACILYIKDFRPEAERHMPSVLEFGVWGANNQQAMDILFDSLPAKHLAVRYYNIFRIAEYRVRAGILIGFATRLQLFLDPGIAHMWSKSDFNLSDVGRKKMALFILISDSDETYKMPIALTWAQLYQDLYRLADENGGKCPVPVRCIKDEFLNIGTIIGFEKTTSTCRSRQIYIMIIIQALPQFKNRYDKDRWAEIWGNMDTTIFLATNDLETAKWFSERIGPTTIQVQSTSAGGSGDTRTNESYIRRSLMSADELMRQDRTKCIVMQNGRYPCEIEKVDYTDMGYDFEKEDWTKLRAYPSLDIALADYRAELEEYMLKALELMAEQQGIVYKKPREKKNEEGTSVEAKPKKTRKKAEDEVAATTEGGEASKPSRKKKETPTADPGAAAKPKSNVPGDEGDGDPGPVPPPDDDYGIF